MTEKLKVLDLFSGIGGFSLGLERTGGFETVAFCEIEKFPQRVLRKHWPEVPIYEDVRKLTAARLAADGITPNVITGGFPCQDISVAGKQAGLGEGTRSGLWSECLRLISELRPAYAIFENSAALLTGPKQKNGYWFSRILIDLACVGYNAEWENIPAAAVGAPHMRERCYLLCYPDKNLRQRNGVAEHLSQFKGKFPQDCKNWCGGRSELGDVSLSERRSAYADARRIAYGFPDWVDRVGACGNAVVPQIPEMIGRAIIEAEAA